MTDRDLQQKRYIAAGIDIAVAIAIGIVFAIVGMVLGFAFSSADSTSMVGVYLPRVISFLGSLVSLAYILGRDVLAGDRSIGKKLQDIRVVTTTGAPLDFMTSARRNGIFAIGAALGVVSATFGLIPCLGDAVNCMLIPLQLLGFVVAVGAAIYEILQITQHPEGIRFGDKTAGTRVVR
jgi:RDD family protein